MFLISNIFSSISHFQGSNFNLISKALHYFNFEVLKLVYFWHCYGFLIIETKFHYFQLLCFTEKKVQNRCPNLAVKICVLSCNWMYLMLHICLESLLSSLPSLGEVAGSLAFIKSLLNLVINKLDKGIILKLEHYQYIVKCIVYRIQCSVHSVHTVELSSVP